MLAVQRLARTCDSVTLATHSRLTGTTQHPHTNLSDDSGVIDMTNGSRIDGGRDSDSAASRRVDLPRLVRPDGTPVRVLVIDDEPNLTDLLGMALRYEGWDVADAGTGTAALRRVRELRPDVAVLDWMLPDAEGPDVLRRLRTVSPGLPVLFLTAKDSVADRIAGLTARRRRLRDQAVQPRGGRGPAPRAAAPDECHSRGRRVRAARR